LILRAPGANCDVETAFAFERAGGQADRVHVRRLLERPKLLADYQVLCIPGGFSYGDDLAAGKILGTQLRLHLADEVARFREEGKLILGICNGFQVLIRSGILLQEDAQAGPPATLAWNESGKFEDRWVRLAVCGGRSPFLAGIERMELPVAHAEGRFVPRDRDALDTLDRNGQLVLRYVGAGDGDSPVPYPANPNGSVFDVAGVCDATGRVLGMMPHPERHVDRTQHPRWTRGSSRPTTGHAAGDGLRLFQNAVKYFN
jgi:phosphoribosylformylglycinamidine synthase